MNFAVIQLYQVLLDPFGHIIIRLPLGSCIISPTNTTLTAAPTPPYPNPPRGYLMFCFLSPHCGLYFFQYSCSKELCLILFFPLLGTWTLKSPTGLVLTRPLLSHILLAIMISSSSSASASLHTAVQSAPKTVPALLHQALLFHCSAENCLTVRH